MDSPTPKPNAAWWHIPDSGGLHTPDFYTLAHEDGHDLFVPFYETLTEADDGARRSVAFLTYPGGGWGGVSFCAWCEGFHLPASITNAQGELFCFEAKNGVWHLVHHLMFS
jgi:hypothetical protein